MNIPVAPDSSVTPRGSKIDAHSQRTSRTNRIFVVGLLLMTLICSLGVAGAIVALGLQATAVRDQLQNAMDLIPRLREELEAGDAQQAQDTFASLQDLTSSARGTVTGPLWKVGSMLPLIGPNFDAVAATAVSADDVASRALGPLLSHFESLDWRVLSPANGKLDIVQLREAAPSIVSASDTVRISHDRMARINTRGLIPEVHDAVIAATAQLADASRALSTASSVARLLPAMLGGEEPRNYLVLVQNSAETRATGGIPGALAVIRTNDGRIELDDQGSASDIGRFSPPLEVDPEQVLLYTERIGSQMQNVNLSPDFPTAASTAKAMWEARNPEQTIDGVLAMDPIVLRNLLGVTGPIELQNPELRGLLTGTALTTSLTPENVVPTLLSDVYREIDEPAVQDSYFAAVAADVFSAFTSGQGDGAAFIGALTESAMDQRLFLWSSRVEEQDVISTTRLAGTVTGTNGGDAAFGVYFNDGTGAKMDFYADRTVQLIQRCPSNGYHRFSVRVSISNTAPIDAATALPAYVTGDGAFGVAPGRIRTNYVFYGPAQSLVESARVDGKSAHFSAGRHGQRPVGTITAELGPGESRMIELDFFQVVQDSTPHLSVTPTIESREKVVLPDLQDVSCG